MRDTAIGLLIGAAGGLGFWFLGIPAPWLAGSMMAAIVAVFSNVKIGMPDPHLGKGLVEEVRSPMYATCIGLVLKGFEDIAEEGAEKNNMLKKTATKAKASGDGVIKGFLGSFRKWIDDDQSMEDFK